MQHGDEYKLLKLAEKAGSLTKVSRDETRAWEVLRNNPCELITCLISDG